VSPFCPALLVLLLAGAAPGAGEPSSREAFALRDGDTVVFLGDSITAAGAYVRLIETYTLLRFPGRKVRFVNAGFGGDTAEGGMKRLARDVFGRGASVAVVTYGLNDIGWGLRADAGHKRRYLEAVRGIAEACRRRQVRLFLCSAPVTAADPEKSEGDFLQTMCDEGMALAKSLGHESIDVQRGMRLVQKRVWAANRGVKDPERKDSMHAPDGAHLNELGHMAMAFAILKGLGAPREVSAAALDARTGQVVRASGCVVRDVAVGPERIEFTRLDAGLPLNYGLFFALHYRFVPVLDELCCYQLSIQNLPEARYEVLAAGRSVGRFTAGQLREGVNLASATTDAWQPGGPWDAQAAVLRQVTEARHQLGSARMLAGLYLPDDLLRPHFQQQADAASAQIEDLQRSMAKPRPYRFTIQRAAAP
jgi:lysophospholipase L1-like esterase